MHSTSRFFVARKIPRSLKRSRIFQRYCEVAGFTLVELLTVLGIVSLLFSLLMPAVLALRESARSVSCANQSRQIVLATLNFEASRREYPSFFVSELPKGQRYAGDYGIASSIWICGFALLCCSRLAIARADILGEDFVDIAIADKVCNCATSTCGVSDACPEVGANTTVCTGQCTPCVFYTCEAGCACEKTGEKTKAGDPKCKCK